VANFLYRRGAQYYARLRIPRPLRATYGKPDLRASLQTTNRGEAQLRVLEAVLAWRRDFVRLKAMLDARQVVMGSPLLLGDGLIPLASAARECGLSVDAMLREAINRAIELRLDALGWQGTDMPAAALEHDHDGALLPVDSAMGRDRTIVTGGLFLRRESLPLIADGRFEDSLFYRDAQRLRAVVALPRVSVAVGALLIDKRDAEAMRLDLATGVTPAMIEAATRAPAQKPHAALIHKYGGMRASELLQDFYKAKRPRWSHATIIAICGEDGNGGMCGVFVELMGDPALSEIDGALMLRYYAKLQTLPANLDRTRRRLKTTTLAQLIEASENLPHMSETRAHAYVTKLSEAFGWAVRRDFMPRNPAAGLLERKKKTTREQDERDEFSDENLHRIFSAPWFTTGKGKRTHAGTYRDFQPFYYWLPVIAMFAGGRLNELAQLHLKDVARTAKGTWFLDFNLDGSGKIDEPDKRLKTVNSTRQVPMHPELIRLGLPEYAAALTRAGHDRLFPELRFDRVKGYGKAAGSWFNERYLGTQLKILRDGKQTFHSFRHGFVTGLYRLDPAPSEFIINQLSGHERGDTISANRYAKDAGPDALLAHIDRLTFRIPSIAPFDVVEGVVAVEHALARKVKKCL
jgi:integrase